MNERDYKNRMKHRRKQRFQRVALNVLTPQPCGDCQACCEAIGVHELDKPVYTKCQHQCATGCGIYADRPKSCQTYYCLYQGGFFADDETLRPDKLGIIFDARVASNEEDCLAAWETREGASDEPAARKVLERLANKFVILIVRYKSDRRRLIGPKHRIEKIAYANLKEV